MMHLTRNDTWILTLKFSLFFTNHTIQVEVFLITKTEHFLSIPHYSVLNCKFVHRCHFVRIQIEIAFQYSLHRLPAYPQRAAAFVADLPAFLRSVTLNSSNVHQITRGCRGQPFLSGTDPVISHSSTIPFANHRKQTKKRTPWPESANELYRPSDRRLSVKLVPTFADKRCRVVRVTDPYGRIL
jgi:hypothetical protein